MRRASQLIITSLKELRHSSVVDGLNSTHIDHYSAFYKPLCAHLFSSISLESGSSSVQPPPPAATAAVSDNEEEDKAPSTSSDTLSIDTKHRYRNNTLLLL